MDSSSSSSSLVVDILYRLDKLHVAASVYGMVLRDRYCTNRYYCFALYICTYITFIDFVFGLFIYFYIFLWRETEREREDPCHDKRKQEEFNLFREYFFGLFTSLVWFLFFLIFDSLRNYKNQNIRLQVKL